MWVAQVGGYTVRVRLNKPSKDFVEVQYSNVQVNPTSLTEASVRLKVPKGVRKVNPAK